MGRRRIGWCSTQYLYGVPARGHALLVPSADRSEDHGVSSLTVRRTCDLIRPARAIASNYVLLRTVCSQEYELSRRIIGDRIASHNNHSRHADFRSCIGPMSCRASTIAALQPRLLGNDAMESVWSRVLDVASSRPPRPDKLKEGVTTKWSVTLFVAWRRRLRKPGVIVDERPRRKGGWWAKRRLASRVWLGNLASIDRIARSMQKRRKANFRGD